MVVYLTMNHEQFAWALIARLGGVRYTWNVCTVLLWMLEERERWGPFSNNPLAAYKQNYDTPTEGVEATIRRIHECHAHTPKQIVTGLTMIKPSQTPTTPARLGLKFSEWNGAERGKYILRVPKDERDIWRLARQAV